MRRIPIDCTKVKFISSGKAAQRPRYAELSDGTRKRVPDSQDEDAQGRPVWIIDCLVADEDADRAEIASVRVGSYEVPSFPMGEEVKFVGLVAVPYVNNNRVAISYQAEGVEGAGKIKGQAA